MTLMLDESTAREDVLTTREVVGATLEVTRGPDEGQRLRLAEPSLVIGSGPVSGWRLTDHTVSREHVRLELTPTGVLVHDLGSKNGTWVGALQVHRVTVNGDAALKIGATTVQLTLDAKPTELVATEREQFGEAFARSFAMRHLFASLLRAAPSELSILLEGESGVGKELLARAIHDHSVRRLEPFVAVDCGSMPADLIESELFGHERGAFTGADKARVGLFQQANGGTIFLDELGELPVELQPKLLRVLQQREVRPVGSNKTHPIDIRVLAATNKNLKEQCAARLFRDDLYYRVAELRVRVPSLRERPDDIAPLATRFLRDLTGDPRAELPEDILSMLASYAWPGNVRELRNVVSRVAMLDARDRSELFDTSGSMRRGARREDDEDYSAMAYQDARRIVVDRLDAVYFPGVMARAGGVIARAAELSGMARSSFYRMLERVGDVRTARDED